MIVVWEMKKRTLELHYAIERLYEVFSRYGGGTSFCGLCYDDREIKYITGTEVREINEDVAQKLLWETGDHWESSEVYRHYLPRILDVLAPPISCEDLYPQHLFEVMRYLDFRHWPEHEQEAVVAYMDAVTASMEFLEPSDREEWMAGVASLSHDSPRLPRET